jgi:hypothetical protein
MLRRLAHGEEIGEGKLTFTLILPTARRLGV